MAPRFCVTRRSFYIITLVNPAKEFDKLADAQGPAKRSNPESNEAPTSPKAITLPLVPLTKDLFTKFMKVFIKTTQAQAQALVEPRKRLLKARTPEIYSGKSHMDCYYFC